MESCKYLNYIQHVVVFICVFHSHSTVWRIRAAEAGHAKPNESFCRQTYGQRKVCVCVHSVVVSADANLSCVDRLRVFLRRLQITAGRGRLAGSLICTSGWTALLSHSPPPPSLCVCACVCVCVCVSHM